MFCTIEQRPSKRLLYMWQSAAAAGLLVLCVSGYFAYVFFGIYALLPISILISLLLLTMYVYLPQLWKSIAYVRNEGKMTIKNGVIRHQTKMICRNQVQYVMIRRNIIERLFAVSTLIMFLPCGKVRLCGLAFDDAHRLAEMLRRREENDRHNVYFG